MPPPLPFRGAAKKRPKLHPAEQILLGIITLHLCFLPWALGAMRVWSQETSGALAIAGFVVALWPRRYDAETSEVGSFRLIMWPKLVRFPIFWIGAIFLAYILVQALNPAWRYVEFKSLWWLVRIQHTPWLPHGMDTPFAKSSPWRSLLIYGSAWLTACAIWVGFTRRRSLLAFLTALAVNAFLLALLGLAERGLHADKIFWSWQPPASYFVSSFTYKNHAGAYFNLLLSLCAALAVAYHASSRRRLKKSSPSGLFAFMAIILALIVIFSYSRAATILLLVYLAFALVVVGAGRLLSADRSRNQLAGLALIFVLLGGSALSALYFLPTGEAFEGMDKLVKSYQSPTPSFRRQATLATLDMFRDAPGFGWGAGSFRFAFPIYQRRFPSIYQEDVRRYYWEHAHNDYAELLAEFGVAGASLLVLGAGYYAATLMRRRFWEHPPVLLLAGGCAVTLVHSLGDFNFFNPAILITWCAFWPTLVRWMELEGATSPEA